jgi:ATP-dependent Clp protease ATP-binding subunit ClpC
MSSNIIFYIIIVGVVFLYLLWTNKLNTETFKALFKVGGKNQTDSSGKGTPMLDLYTIDFTKLSRDQKKDPVIGRANEIMRLTQVLSRRTKNNAILLGDPGVGKTAIVEGLAQLIVNMKVPEVLRGKRLLSLQVASLLAGTKYRGEFEERAKKIVQEISNSKRTIILFVDEIHTIIQSQGSEGSINLADILKPALARGDLQMIGATTITEYDKYIRTDSSLERRFQPVDVQEPSVEETIAILNGIKEKYKEYHKVEFTDEAIKGAVTLAQQYIKERKLPDKAIDVIDEAASMVKVSHTDNVVHGLLVQAAMDKDPELARLWKEIQLADNRIATAATKDVETFIRYREDMEKQLDQKGVAVVDYSDVEKVVHEWIKLIREEIK